MAHWKSYHTISTFAHWGVARELARFAPRTVIDMGGTGKTRDFVDATVTNANILDAIDATNLHFSDNEFDASLSIATLEHVNDMEGFLSESLRVSRKGAVHWFPVGSPARDAERVKSALGHHHPCTILDVEELRQHVERLNCRWRMVPHMSIGEHLLLLATINPDIHCEQTFELVSRMGSEPYGYLLVLERGEA